MNALQWTVMESAIDDPSFVMGVVRLSPDGEVRYVNRAARSMTGDEIRVGRKLANIGFDQQSSEQVRVAMQQRFERHRGTSYSVCLQSRSDGPKVRLRVSALPEYDASGRVIGSVGFLTDESVDFVTNQIHEVIQKAWDSRILLSDMTRLLRDIVTFDSIIITAISEERRHLRRMFEEPQPPVEVVPTVWWPMPPFIRAMIDPLQTGPLHLEAMFATPDFVQYAREDPTVAQFLERGFRHSLVLGVHYRGKLCATVSLMRKDDVPFTSTDYDRCVRLPIAEAVNAAIRFEVQLDLQFGSQFIQRIAQVAHDPREIGQRLVDQLQEHHGWDHVSLFRIDSEGARLDLVCQAGSRKFPQDYSQPVTIGLMGKAYSDRRDINVGDVRSRELAEDFHPALEGTLSELVLRVPGTAGRWLLNIESQFRDAFADDEQKSVAVQLRVAGFILENMASLELKSAIVRCVDDAVFQTNDKGLILDANPAAVKLLGREISELRRVNLAAFLHTERDSESTEDAREEQEQWKPGAAASPSCDAKCLLTRAVESVQPLPLKLRGSDGSVIPVLMSGAALPARLGRVFIASDLRTQNRIERLQVFTKLFQQIATEIRMPLALAHSFLRDALELRPGELTERQIRELVDKSARQIRKADVPLETVARFAISDTDTPLVSGLFDIREAVKEVIAELPSRDVEKTSLQAEGHMLVRAPRRELQFCIRSLLAYLFRHRAQVERVVLSIASRANRLRVSLALRATEEGDGREPAGEQPEFDFALTEPVIADLMGRMGGSYKADGSRRRFRLFFGDGE